MKKLFLTALLSVLSLSLFSADNEAICKALSNKICDNYNCYITKQIHSGKYYIIALKCPSLWEGDPGFAVAEINQLLNKYSDLTTVQAFTADDSGGYLEKIMECDDLTVSIEYRVESNSILIAVYPSGKS